MSDLRPLNTNKNMNRIEALFQKKNKNILSIYFTAGFPRLDSAPGIISALTSAGADMIEIGMPFSDPLADGPVIQGSSATALRNGMNIRLLFEQLAGIRKTTPLPLLLMGYINPVLKLGVGEFCRRCSEAEIDGLIIPDLPPEIYQTRFKPLFKKYGLDNILLISPQSDVERIRRIDAAGSGFVYMVSSSSTTGIRSGFSENQISYFKRINDLRLSKPRLIGFGISDSESFNEACRFANGAIIGSTFVRLLGERGTGEDCIRQFIREIRGNITVEHFPPE